MGKMRLSIRLILAFASLIAIQVSMVGFTFISVDKIRAGAESIATDDVSKDMQQQGFVIVQEIRGLVLYPELITREQVIRNVEDARAKYRNDWSQYQKLTAGDPAHKNLSAQILNANNDCDPLIDKIMGLIKQNQYLEAKDLLLKKANPALQGWLDRLIENVNYKRDQNREFYQTAKQTTQNIQMGVVILGTLMDFLGIGFAFFMVRSITKPLKRIANGLNDSVQQVVAASQQLSASAQQLSDGSAQQASSIEEASSSLQESASMLQQSNANTTQAVQLSEYTNEFSLKGNQEMNQMMNSIEEIKKSSNEIGKIIKVIDDIAFQTNILALNAAIEAARAGETGLGFAVVAEEVRNLAQRSAQAAQNTNAIIDSNIEKSGQGVRAAERVRDALNEITVQAKKVRELMEEISASSREQSQGVEQVNLAMGQVELIVQQNAANAEENAAAAEELNTQAENMKQIVSELTQLIHGVSKTV